MTTTAATANTLTMQGITVPNAVQDAPTFFAKTRRTTVPFVSNKSFGGLGTTDTYSLLKANIVSGINLRLVGTVVTTHGSGTVATTARWPYDFVRVRLSANGQSQLINARGWKLRAREMMANEDSSDRGVSQSISGATVTQGTLSYASESWGLGQAQSSISDGTYNFDIEIYIPIAYDETTLLGALFLQTASTDLSLSLDWANSSDLFTLTSNATAVVTCNIQAQAISFSIPEINGSIVVPDLTTFHGLVENRFTGMASGDNEIPLVGQGVGRQLLRFYWQTWNGSAPQVPLALTDTNYGQAAWRFGGNDTPESWITARALRQHEERLFNCDLGGSQGFGVWDFAVQSAFRDSIDEGAATELRFLVNYPNGLTLTSPVIEYVQETAFAGAIGA
jgi:hypothetical protein